MRLRGALQTATGWRSLLVATVLCSNAVAKENKPRVTVTEFSHFPSNLNYFEDSDVVLFQDYDENTVYRSDDAGEKWTMIKDIPEGKAWDLFLHPFDSKRAYVLTRDNTHWKTEDRGKSWKEFFTDASPSMFRMPLSFHASDPDKIIFNGQDCASIFCTEQVSLC